MTVTPRILTAAIALLLIACSQQDDKSKTTATTTTTRTAAAPAPTAAQQAASAIEPESLAALERMSAYLRTVNNFEIRARTTTEKVLTDGQKVQFAGMTTYRVRRPNGFYIEKVSDRLVRQYYYDGSNLTVVAPRMNFYASVEAPPTIQQTVEAAEERYDLEVPLADLFYWGTPEARTSDLRSGIKIGYAKIEGVDTDQYAFRQDNLDWQIFIQRGDRPLPRKIVITTHEDTAQPQYTAVLDWNLAPRFAPATFTYRPPASAHRINIVERL